MRCVESVFQEEGATAAIKGVAQAIEPLTSSGRGDRTKAKSSQGLRAHHYFG